MSLRSWQKNKWKIVFSVIVVIENLKEPMKKLLELISRAKSEDTRFIYEKLIIILCTETNP